MWEGEKSFGRILQKEKKNPPWSSEFHRPDCGTNVITGIIKHFVPEWWRTEGDWQRPKGDQEPFSATFSVLLPCCLSASLISINYRVITLNTPVAYSKSFRSKLSSAIKRQLHFLKKKKGRGVVRRGVFSPVYIFFVPIYMLKGWKRKSFFYFQSESIDWSPWAFFFFEQK